MLEAMKRRILIVEDEPAISDNIQFVIESEGLETVRVATGLAVMPALNESSVDLIVLDIGLPDINGFDLLREIRKTRTTPIILLTALTAEISIGKGKLKHPWKETARINRLIEEDFEATGVSRSAK